MPISAFQKSLIFGVVLVFLFSSSFLVLWSLIGSHSFGWDESVYLTKARSWIEGTPADQFGVYRPIGMASFGWLMLQFGESEQGVRMFGAIFGAVTLVFLFLLFRGVANIWVGLAVTVVTGTSLLFLREAPQFFNDVASSGVLFGVLWLVWKYYKSAGYSKAIYIAAPLAALVFYIRYGVVLAFGVIGIVTVAVLLQKFANKENSIFTPLGKTIGIFGILILPHFIHSFLATDNVLGILKSGGGAAGRQYLGEGLLHYAQWLPYTLAGPVVGGTALAGILITIVILARKNLRQRYEGLLWLGAIGIGTLFVTGLLIHAEPRYIFFSVCLLSGVGIAGIYMLLNDKPKILHTGFALLILLVALPFGAIHYQQAYAIVQNKKADVHWEEYVHAYRNIQDDASEPGGCAVWAADFRPQVSWYTKCSVFSVTDRTNTQKQLNDGSQKNYYSIVLTKSQNNQIKPETAEQYGVLLQEIYRSEENSSHLGRGQIIVYRINYQKPGVPQYIPNQAGD